MFKHGGKLQSVIDSTKGLYKKLFMNNLMLDCHLIVIRLFSLRGNSVIKLLVN